MNIIKKNAKQFSLLWISQEPNTVVDYENSNLNNCIQWVYILHGNLQIKYWLNGYEGFYSLSYSAIGDLRQINGLDFTWGTSDSEYQALAFISNDPSISYECDGAFISQEIKKIKFEYDTYAVPVSDTLLINDKSILVGSYAKIPKNIEVNLKSASADSLLLLFYNFND